MALSCSVSEIQCFLLTSTCSVGSDKRTRRNGSTPISHILVVYGGLLMNFLVVVGRSLRISTPRIYIATLTTRLSEFALLLPVLIHHHSRHAQLEARLSRSVQLRQTTSRSSYGRCPTSSVCPTGCPPGYWRRTSMSWRHSSVGFTTGLWNVASYRRALNPATSCRTEESRPRRWRRQVLQADYQLVSRFQASWTSRRSAAGEVPDSGLLPDLQSAYREHTTRCRPLFWRSLPTI